MPKLPRGDELAKVFERTRTLDFILTVVVLRVIRSSLVHA